MKRFGFIAGICFWFCMIISCATLQEVNVNLDEEEQNLDIIISEQKFAELDAKEEDIDIRNKNNNMGDPADAPERKRSTRKPFIPPTVEEVREYCTERENSVDPESFVDFYASKGWMIGKNKMKDWKAAVRTWEQGDKRKGVKNSGGNRKSPEGTVAGRVGTWL